MNQALVDLVNSRRGHDRQAGLRELGDRVRELVEHEFPKRNEALVDLLYRSPLFNENGDKGEKGDKVEGMMGVMRPLMRQFRQDVYVARMLVSIKVFADSQDDVQTENEAALHLVNMLNRKVLLASAMSTGSMESYCNSVFTAWSVYHRKRSELKLAEADSGPTTTTFEDLAAALGHLDDMAEAHVKTTLTELVSHYVNLTYLVLAVLELGSDSLQVLLSRRRV